MSTYNRIHQEMRDEIADEAEARLLREYFADAIAEAECVDDDDIPMGLDESVPADQVGL